MVLSRLLSGVLAAALTASHANAFCREQAMLVFDGSASMAELTFDLQDNTRIEDARIALRRALPEITLLRDVGLLTYGPGGADSCSGIDLRFGPKPDAAAEIIAEVEALRPEGLTPLSASVQRAAEELDYTREPAVVVLVTDGSETCGGRPCALGAALEAEGADLTVHVIGFKVISDFFTWNNPEAQAYLDGEIVAKCLADRTGGTFVSTKTVDELIVALQSTLGCALIGRL